MISSAYATRRSLPTVSTSSSSARTHRRSALLLSTGEFLACQSCYKGCLRERDTHLPPAVPLESLPEFATTSRPEQPRVCRHSASDPVCTRDRACCAIATSSTRFYTELSPTRFRDSLSGLTVLNPSAVQRITLDGVAPRHAIVRWS